MPMPRFKILIGGPFNPSFSGSFDRAIYRDGPTKPVLLLSETRFRESVDISDSLSSKSVISAIKEAQDFYLAAVIGDLLYNALMIEVEEDAFIPEHKYLLDTFIQPLLIYQSAALVCGKTIFKVGNIGVADLGTKSKYFNPGRIMDYYNQQAGNALRRLTDYLSKHMSDYSKYLNSRDGIRNHVSAVDSTPIFLGLTPHYKYPKSRNR